MTIKKKWILKYDYIATIKLNFSFNLNKFLIRIQNDSTLRINYLKEILIFKKLLKPLLSCLQVYLTVFF